MGERKGQNKYYPPDFDPKKHKSLSGYHGQHPLRERARKMQQGILVIRFEMPYNIWCDGCGNHIGMGVRYNAEKSKVGMYYTTPIYKFRMKCHLCNNHFEIKTDPANHDYVIISGARRKEQRWDPTENGQIVPEERQSQKKLATDAMFKLEHGFEDQKKIKSAIPTLLSLEEIQSGKKDDYELNKLARKQFRDEKKMLKSEADADIALLAKSSLEIELMPEAKDDVRLAGLLKYKSLESYEEKEKLKRLELEQSSIFESTLAGNTLNSSTFRNSKAEIAREHLLKISQQQRLNPFCVTEPEQHTITKSCNTAIQQAVVVKKVKQNSNNTTTLIDEEKTSEVKESFRPQSYKLIDSVTKNVEDLVVTASSEQNANNCSHSISLVANYESSDDSTME